MKRRNGARIARKARRNGGYKNSRMNFTGILVIICIAVFLGYGAAKFVIYPLIGVEDIIVGDEALHEEKNITQEENSIGNEKTNADKEGKNIVEDKLSVAEETAVKDVTEGYYIQFGSFSNKEKAEELISELATIGIKSEMIETEGSYKVRSMLFTSKEEAQKTKATLINTAYSDAFITE